MPSEHLKFVIPGAVLSAIGGFMLFFGILFYMIFRSTFSIYDMFGGYPSMMGSGGFSTPIIVVGAILLAVGIVLLVKGITTYRSNQVSYYKNRARPVQPLSYTPAPAPSYAPSYAPIQTPSTTVLNSPTVIQDPTPPKETMVQEKKFCPSCGATLPEHSQAHFCPTCGGPI